MRVVMDINFNMDDPAYDLDETSEKTMTAMGVMKTIGTLVVAVESSPAVLKELEAIVLPICRFILEKNAIDLYDEVFTAIDTCSYCAKSISPEMWALFPLIYQTFKGEASDYLEEMLPTLDNYVSFGKDVLASNPDVLRMFLDIAFTVFQTEDAGESELVRACQLIESVLLNIHGTVDEVILSFQSAFSYSSAFADCHSNSNAPPVQEDQNGLVQGALPGTGHQLPPEQRAAVSFCAGNAGRDGKVLYHVV
jgi:hypothetical protein